MIFLFLVGSLVYKLSLINSAYFLSFQLSIHCYNTETQEPGLWGSGNSGSLIFTIDVTGWCDYMHFNFFLELLVLFCFLYSGKFLIF